MNIGAFGGGDDLFHGHVSRVVAVRNVVAYADAEQYRILRHDADLRAQPRDVEISQTSVVQRL